MIEPGDLYRHHRVREIETGLSVEVLWDARYAVTGTGVWDYHLSPDGDHFLAASAVHTHPWGRPIRLEEVEPLPDGSGMYHPYVLAVMELQLAMSYEGSWREAAGLPNEWAAAYVARSGIPVPRRPADVWP